MFDLDQFVADCRVALAADKSHKHVRDVVARAVADPASVLKALGEPARAGLNTLHQSHDLTVLNIVWAPMMTVMPHNHSMWAVIGIYTGREDNIFWRRLPGGLGKVEAAGAKALCERDAEPLGHNIIHSVTNPIPRLTGGSTCTAAIFSIPRTGANGTRKPCWKARSIPNARFASSKRQMQFCRFLQPLEAKAWSRGFRACPCERDRATLAHSRARCPRPAR